MVSVWKIHYKLFIISKFVNENRFEIENSRTKSPKIANSRLLMESPFEISRWRRHWSTISLIACLNFSCASSRQTGSKWAWKLKVKLGVESEKEDRTLGKLLPKDSISIEIVREASAELFHAVWMHYCHGFRRLPLAASSLLPEWCIAFKK